MEQALLILRRIDLQKLRVRIRERHREAVAVDEPPVLVVFRIEKVDDRASQTVFNRSTQIQRDLNAYWFMLRDGLRRLQTMMTTDDARYIASIFKGRALASCEDALWSDEYLCSYVRKSGLYGDSERATRLADLLDSAGALARFALMDWVRRVIFNGKNERLFDHWLKETNAQ